MIDRVNKTVEPKRRAFIDPKSCPFPPSLQQTLGRVVSMPLEGDSSTAPTANQTYALVSAAPAVACRPDWRAIHVSKLSNPSANLQRFTCLQNGVSPHAQTFATAVSCCSPSGPASWGDSTVANIPDGLKPSKPSALFGSSAARPASKAHRALVIPVCAGHLSCTRLSLDARPWLKC